MSKILIIENNKDVNEILKEVMEAEGYDTESAYDGMEGLKKAEKEDSDLILLDIMLPYKNGDEVLRGIRKKSNVPVIILSAKDMAGTKIDLLELGADDYITKPFDLGEVAERVAANLGRVEKQQHISNRLTYKDLILDTDLKQVSTNGQVLDATSKEYKILELFVSNKGKVFSKANIYESVWKEEYLGDDNAVKTHISNLRGKLKKFGKYEDYIETIWRMGYRLYRE